MKEVWKDIEGFEGRYRVSNWGRVESLVRGNRFGGGVILRKKPLLRKPHVNTSGYLHVRLAGDDKKDISIEIHRLVAKHFIPNPNNLTEINHLKGKSNNRADALEWTTRTDNLLHAHRHGLKKGRKGEPIKKLSEDEVLKIFSSTLPQRQIAKKFNVSRTCISSIKTGHRWSNITGKKKTTCPT